MPVSRPAAVLGRPRRCRGRSLREETGPCIVIDLRCENRESLLGADTKSPLFSWALSSAERSQAQTAYRLQVAKSAAGLESGSGRIWDGGKRALAPDLFAAYDGPELEPGTEYFWRVRVWDGRGRPSGWSPASSFVTGLARPDDWSGARWMACEELPVSLKLVPGVHGSGDSLGETARRRPIVPLFRKDFEARGDAVKALVFVSGLGHYELTVNGRRVAGSFLAPGWTAYQRSCLYNVYDVTGLVAKGWNTLGLIVGNGFFNINRERYRKLVIACGMPMALLKMNIDYRSGESDVVVSGPDWKTAPSPITYSSIYGGEDYDARLEQPGWDSPAFADSSWKAAIVVDGPGGRLKPETDHPLKVTDEIAVAKITRPQPGMTIFDFGQNASGVIRVGLKGKPGLPVKITPGELLGKDGLVNQRASGEPCFWTYTLKGEGEETWSPRFSYYGFRYAQVEGAVPSGKGGNGGTPEILDIRLLHTRNSAPRTGSFACSNELFNRIYRLILWAIQSNLASVVTDCPHREKLGWLEQTHLMGASIQYNFDIRNLYGKLVDDMIEAQLENGLVPDIAPEFVPFEGGFRDSAEWGSASVILPWLLYEWYGDRSAMERAYPMMSRYAAYLGGRSRGHLLTDGLGDWYDLGPKPPGPSQLTPLGLTATATYFYDLKLLARMAGILGRPEDASGFERLAAAVKAAFNAEYFRRDSASYATGSQTSLAMPLCVGLVEENYRRAVFESLVRSIREGGHALTAGDVGFHYLIKALEEGGASQLIFEMNSRSDVPGYGYQLAKGATALTESWPAREDVSNNHLMLGHIMEWLYSGLAGIRQAGDSQGFRKIMIAPHPAGDITWTKARYRSVRGDIVCSWKIEADGFSLDLEIPPGAPARVLLPAARDAKIFEGGRPIGEAGETRFLGWEDGRFSLEVGSGNYRFKAVR
ncbi:MAG: alpha-L-rhamnosidase [Candidatus Aminicenantes bacterium RBG_16_63_16]|nr:MAG: alpha-L-rhamnosidase [Candidatus Aminicenantes bacterium RBG_16_63_16]